MTIYFLDTSFLLGLVMETDQNHAIAQSKWQWLRTSNPRLITTSYVFDETATYLNSRGLHEKAVEICDKILLSRTVEMIHVNEDLFYKGWDLFRKYEDKRYSLTDCVSFVVMNQRGLQIALTFNKHFKQAGFQVEPL